MLLYVTRPAVHVAASRRHVRRGQDLVNEVGDAHAAILFSFMECSLSILSYLILPYY